MISAFLFLPCLSLENAFVTRCTVHQVHQINYSPKTDINTDLLGVPGEPEEQHSMKANLLKNDN